MPQIRQSFIQKRWYPPWWLKHEFELDVSAPVGSPYTGSGAGALVILDTNSKLSFTGGRAAIATGGTSSTPAIFGAQQTRVAGRGVVGILTQSAQNAEFGWNNAQSGSNLIDCIRFNSTGSAIRDNGTAIDVGLTLSGGPQIMAIIQRSAGFWAFMRGSISPSWKMYWVGVGSSADLYPAFMSVTTTYVGNIDTFRGVDFGQPFDSDYGFATSRLAGARSANDPVIHENNFFAEWTQTTLPSSGNTDIRFRMVDASNYIQVLISSTGALTLNTVTAGTPTQIATTAAAVANGGRVVISMDGSTVRSYVNSVVKSVGSSSSFTGQNDGILSALGTGGAVSDLVTWPLYPNSRMMQMLNIAVLS